MVRHDSLEKREHMASVEPCLSVTSLKIKIESQLSMAKEKRETVQVTKKMPPAWKISMQHGCKL
jgi:hypothetical protein